VSDVDQTIRRRLADDTGIGMILVIGITIFVAGLTVTAAVIATNGLGQSRHRVHYEQSLAAAESGIDYALSQVQAAFEESNADFPLPNAGVPTSGCAVEPLTLDAPYTDGGDEVWARAQLAELMKTAAGRACLMNTAEGQVLILKPKNHPSLADLSQGHIYAQGWSPRYEPGAVSRTIKVDYVLLPYAPEHAIITQGDLYLTGSATVQGALNANGVGADVHTNTTLHIVGKNDITGSVTFTDGFTQSGGAYTVGNPGGEPTTHPSIPLPPVSALAFYRKAPGLDDTAMSTWWDLCPDGMVRTWSEDGPCDSSQDGQTPASFNSNWTFAESNGIPVWTYDSKAGIRGKDSGTFFVHHANVNNPKGGNATTPRMTVIASATADIYDYTDRGEMCDDKQFGNISWKLNDLTTPAFHNLFFLADGDLDVEANLKNGVNASDTSVISGMYIAGDQVKMGTSSASLVGSVLSREQCSPEASEAKGTVEHNAVQGQVVSFDPNGASPFSTVIATTLWLELGGAN
jgi:hypothetical protein